MSVILEDETGWGVSFTGSNPELADYVHCASYVDAEKLYCRLNYLESESKTLKAEITTIKEFKASCRSLRIANWQVSYLRGEVAKLEAEREEREKQEPVGVVCRNDAGQIHMTDGHDNFFNISKWIGKKLYILPPVAKPAALEISQSDKE